VAFPHSLDFWDIAYNTVCVLQEAAINMRETPETFRERWDVWVCQ